MKKIILCTFLLLSLGVTAQTIDTTSLKGYSVVKIATPFKVKWSDTAMGVFINVTSSGDNLKDAAYFQWVIFSKYGQSLASGYMGCAGADYKDWDGSNTFPFIFVASKLDIAIK